LLLPLLACVICAEEYGNSDVLDMNGTIGAYRGPRAMQSEIPRTIKVSLVWCVELVGVIIEM
jgi:hypothetical protein